jgi:predicted membrane-bound dolichyl-phosphate-mannose-protein mannosyltransferase
MALYVVSETAFAAAGSQPNASSSGLQFGGLPPFTVITLVGSVLIFGVMVANGAWWQATITVFLSVLLLGIVTFLVPVVGLLLAIGVGPWLLLLALVFACVLSRRA